MRNLTVAAIAAFGLLFISSGKITAAEAPPLFATKSMTPELALDLARATLKACRDAGFQTAVAVVDRSGTLQVLLRDRFAGPHTPRTARRKAWTALSFRANTTDLADNTQAGKEASGARDIPGILMLGGGVLVRAGGELVGAVGVSGGPGGKADENCAKKGLEAIEDKLPF
ncbi:MAG: heme-binding protein [Rhodospirillales bacterium]|nr:heme-binding protein [Rhodospirillales bacterium]